MRLCAIHCVTYANEASMLLRIGQMVATGFATIAAANDWRG
ncbi:hypothetical protein RSPO_m00389 (plasmid) [Ralstonia solanacearum Po82]|uniref:Uncharacterized protein n=1 Tax=Ralstonia solanacearum (strain Po82) TaxID=1031711 RepID=F6G7M7_RALS8|nr:hypothetical protein RSPO_m00389 [Ralstonia solanacearum Po82]EUJ13026.1 hypothetical protein RSP673_18020 [Ralstonia solanacearum P673]